MGVSATDYMENEKRKNKTDKLAHKLPLIPDTQFLLPTQEECNSTFHFFLYVKTFNLFFTFPWLVVYKLLCRSPKILSDLLRRKIR